MSRMRPRAKHLTFLPSNCQRAEKAIFETSTSTPNFAGIAFCLESQPLIFSTGCSMVKAVKSQGRGRPIKAVLSRPEPTQSFFRNAITLTSCTFTSSEHGDLEVPTPCGTLLGKTSSLFLICLLICLSKFSSRHRRDGESSSTLLKGLRTLSGPIGWKRILTKQQRFYRDKRYFCCCEFNQTQNARKEDRPYCRLRLDGKKQLDSIQQRPRWRH